MTYFLGSKSLKELQGVHPQLVAVVKRAIELTKQDFAVHDGIRTEIEQAYMVRSGASKIMNSKHRIQKDGFGHAVDLVPYINGKMRWEWTPIYLIAEAVRTAAEELGVRLRWGGNWSELTGSKQPVHILVDDYVRLCRERGKPAFIDGPHYELIA